MAHQYLGVTHTNVRCGSIISSNTIPDSTPYTGGGEGAGGIFLHSCSPQIINCLVVNNENDGFNSYSSNFSIKNSIVWGNSPHQIYEGSDVTYSDVEGGFLGTGNISNDPKFVNSEIDDFRLLSTSPCIDSGTNDTGYPLELDFEGNKRIVDGNCDENATVDMGPLEYHDVCQKPSWLNYPVSDDDGSYSISWATSCRAVTYRLERSNDAGKTWTQIYLGTKTLFSETVNNGVFRYRVQAYNSDGSSGWQSSTHDCTVEISTVKNDNFSQAIGISGWSANLEANNTKATREANEPKHAGTLGGKSLWWYWVSPVGGNFRIDTIGSTFDTLLAVYRGSSLESLVNIASNDDVGSDSVSLVSFDGEAGLTYRIAVDGYSGDFGEIGLNLAVVSGYLYVSSDGKCGSKKPCYSTIQGALNAAQSNSTIKIARGTYPDIFSLTVSKAITLSGGWNDVFTSQSANSTFIKAPKAPKGSLKLQMLTIRP